MKDLKFKSEKTFAQKRKLSTLQVKVSCKNLIEVSVEIYFMKQSKILVEVLIKTSVKFLENISP